MQTFEIMNGVAYRLDSDYCTGYKDYSRKC